MDKQVRSALCNIPLGVKEVSQTITDTKIKQGTGFWHSLSDSHLCEGSLEGGGDGAVDEEVGGDVEHDQEVGDGLEAHHPEGGDVLVVLPDAGDLHLDQGDDQDAQEDAQDVTEDVHQHNRDQGNL